ncbi:MAG: 6-carboxytetrahydropterin synthase [Bacteroidales bacterium]|nr:6-carboxytetrahydropterin synthase [Bacteroidales bacterium]
MTQLIRLTREFTFEMAHVLEGYDGPCRNVHGHSYRLYVTVKGFPVSDSLNPKFGMVIDFGDLKKVVMEKIINIFDHAVAVSRNYAGKNRELLNGVFGNMVVVDYQPTCENLVADFAARIAGSLPEGVRLHSLRLYETAKSYAEWFADDNP